MILQLDDFLGFKVNWNAKSENIRELAAQLNLGLDSFIFIDDNPVECTEVSSRFPEVFTIQIPKNSEQMLALIQQLWIFDHPKITAENVTNSILSTRNEPIPSKRKAPLSLRLLRT